MAVCLASCNSQAMKTKDLIPIPDAAYAKGVSAPFCGTIGDVLVVNTMQATGFTKEEYALRHHGGYLGSIVKGNKY